LDIPEYKEKYNATKDIIIDSPPGASCPAINAVMDADYIILVTEPTPFGFNDLKIAREAFKPIKKPVATFKLPSISIHVFDCGIFFKRS